MCLWLTSSLWGKLTQVEEVYLHRDTCKNATCSYKQQYIPLEGKSEPEKRGSNLILVKDEGLFQNLPCNNDFGLIPERSSSQTGEWEKEI